MPTRIQFTTIAVAATLALAGRVEASPASQAPAGTETVSVRVSVADLDLRHKAGVAVAHQRIRRAATLVCGNEPASSGLIVYGYYSSCRRAAFNDAVTDLNTQIASTLASPEATALAANR